MAAKNGLDAVKTDVKWIKQSLGEVHEKLDNLKCQSHAEQLKTVYNRVGAIEKSRTQLVTWILMLIVVIMSVIAFFK